ncbi:hypothetical protein QWY85_20265 [Neolewinella lacunae]|uniref:Capsule assembly protein Wzi n=1 Tax=Neolewinella lacunae TaxID=1517758 RepID=A0A923PMB5_9BACT|nr:hypothetical protein [Neolewinella lacunae]MBC6996788.1 hypothetical protein [Neolewinella lacunae]MDN3637016.1 hypothetical protein [Neolewinella lacunae]
MLQRLPYLLSLLGILLLGPVWLPGQGSPLPTDDEHYELLRRLAIRYGYAGFERPATDLALRPVNRAGAVRLAKTYLERYAADLTKTDRYRLQRFFDDNNEWLALPPLAPADDGDRAAYDLGEAFATASEQSPLYRQQKPLLGLLYPTPANLLEVNRPDFYLRLNPVIDFRYGKQKDDAEDYFYNRRGLRLRAGVDDRIFLHFEILETQRGLPDYVRQYRNRFGALPGAGFLKTYQLDVANVQNGADYLNGQGYVSADLTRHVGARLGYGNHFIGDGERSLLLSDFSNNYPYLELNWRIWKFHYRNLFAELTNGPTRATPTGVPLTKKYLAAHHLSINLGQRLTLGLFEAVVMNREDGFDLAYLNPIILYRTIEQSVGSPDNAIVGLTGRYQTPWRIEAYGQFILDEFKFDELFVERRGWWANKFGYQLGARYVDAFGLRQLDLVVERNLVRPYTYTHRGLSNYTHFAMALAHPLGANFRESLVGLDYRPLPRLHLRGRLYLIEQGEGSADRVVGENINVSHELREMDFGNEIGQGINYQNTLMTLRGSYELKPNLWLEGEYISRNKDSQSADRDLLTSVLNFGVRWNVARRDDGF